MPILQSLISARTAGNVITETAIPNVGDGVERGENSSSPEGHRALPHMVAQMIGIGEQTEHRRDARKIADFYEEEVDAAVANLLTLMEPT